MLRLLIALLLLALPLPARNDAALEVRVRLLAINDFHGHLEPPAGASGLVAAVATGGAAYLAAHVQALQAGHPHSLLVSAGDLINASPYVSAFFHDEPTIEVMNTMGLALNAVGNHEFDDGIAELRRMQEGGCHPQDGCRFRAHFPGARFQFLAANVVNEATGETLFPAYAVRTFDGVQVAFIGMTLEDTPSLVNADGIAGWRFRNEWVTANALVPQIRAQGIEAIVLIIHQGGAAGDAYDGCAALSGPIREIVERLDQAIDVVITGHTHRAYNCRVDGRLVTSAGAYGRLLTAIDLTLDRASGDVKAAVARNHLVTREVIPSAVVAAVVEDARRAAATRDRIVGALTASITRAGQWPRDIQAGASGESALGRLVADAQLWATRAAVRGGAQLALMNPGGLREELAFSGEGSVRYSQLFAVQPFGNTLITLTLTGRQLRELLEQQFTGYTNSQPFDRVLQASRGFAYVWSASAPPGRRVREIMLRGEPLDPDGRYRLTVNDFLAAGGDRFTVLRAGTERQRGVLDVEALEAYVRAHAPVRPDLRPRVTRVP